MVDLVRLGLLGRGCVRGDQRKSNKALALYEEGNDMEGFGLGLFDLFIGVTIAFFGLRFFFAVLPLGAFFIGGYAGAMTVHHLFDEGFLNTFATIVTGIAVGVGLALVAYLAWYVGALIMAGAVGAMLGAGLVAAFTSDADVLTFVVA